MQLQQKRHNRNSPGLSLHSDVCFQGNPPVSVRGQAGAVTRRHRFRLLGFFCYVRPKNALLRLISFRRSNEEEGVLKKTIRSKLSLMSVGVSMLISQTRKALASASAVFHPLPPPPSAAYTPLTFHASVQNKPQYR